MKRKIFLLLIPAAVILAGCNNFLDTLPDNRTEIDDVEKVAELLAGSYIKANYAAMINPRIDFVSDKGTASVLYETNNNTDSFFWNDIRATNRDSPAYFWERAYRTVSASNYALQALDELGNPTEGLPYRGEALLMRSFAHFLLVNLYAKFYEYGGANTSPGIPYVEEPEEVVIKSYDRGTVAQVYQKIERDLVEGLKTVGTEATYRTRGYHFTNAAGNAFASRFYLYTGQWQKVIDHASQVVPKPVDFVQVGTTVVDGETKPVYNVSDRDVATLFASSNFQPWTTTYATAASATVISQQFCAGSTNSNLLVSETISMLSRYQNSWRYNMAKADTDATVDGATPVGGKWKFRVYYLTSHRNSCYLPKYYQLQVREDINSSSVVVHTIFPYLRVEEALLNRAEAYVMLDMLDEALADANIYTRQRIENYNSSDHVVTMERLLDFYGETVSNPEHFINKYGAFGADSWSDSKKALLLYILDVKRNEYVNEGLRYWDLLRWKIPVTHTTIDGRSNTLYPGDDRWVLQIPPEAAMAGVEQNPMTNLLSPVWGQN